MALVASAFIACGAAAGAPRTVDWAHLKYPVDCHGTPTGVLDAVQVPGTGKEAVTVVLLQCMWEDGTGWATVLSYSTSTPRPELLQVVLSQAAGWTPAGVPGGHNYLVVREGGGGFSLRVAGARGKVARCCLNVFATLAWRWGGGRFHEVGRHPEHDPGQ